MTAHRLLNRQRKTQWPVAVLCLLLFLTGCSSSSEAPTGTTTVRVTLSPLASTLPFHVADTEGIFNRNGLEIEATETQDPPTAFTSLTNGQVDIAHSVPTLVLRGAQRGFNVQVVSGLQRSTAENPNGVWITRDPEIDEISELKGKTIAVPALTGVIADSLIYLLQINGLTREDVNLVVMPFPPMADQLAAGRVDAAIAGLPFWVAMKARGLAVHEDVGVEAVTHASGGKVTDAIQSLFAANADFSEKNPDVVRAFRKSLQEAIELLADNPDKARGYLESWLKMPPPVAKTTPLPDWQTGITPEDLEPYVIIGTATGALTSTPDLNELVWQDK